MSTVIQRTLDVLLGLLSAALVGGYGILFKRMRASHKESDALKKGVVALLSNSIIQIYHESSERGFCPVHERQNSDKLYKAYTDLGGNGTIPGLVEKIRALPTEVQVLNEQQHN